MYNGMDQPISYRLSGAANVFGTIGVVNPNAFGSHVISVKILNLEIIDFGIKIRFGVVEIGLNGTRDAFLWKAVLQNLRGRKINQPAFIHTHACIEIGDVVCNL